ncbi:MAG: ABC transporter permease subunit [Streptosporangiales bacterium]|nr:ABC transporter permease subunit [Streptosporangiales bacterium]
MSLRLTLATAGRILAQLRRDPRTIAMLLLVPLILMALLSWVFDDERRFNQAGPALLGLFPFVVMFIVTSIATLRERTSGVLERLLAMPLHKLDLLFGYALAFGLVATVQALVTASVSVWWLGLDIAGSTWLLVVVAVLDALLGVSLGLLASAFARTEFQAVQFMPALVLPQALLCGLLAPRDQMHDVLRWISDALPLSYAVDAMQEVTAHADVTDAVVVDLVVVGGCVVLALLLGAATLRRRTG